MLFCSTADWSITKGATSVAAVNKSLQTWFHGPKSPGLIVLEHEVCPLHAQHGHLCLTHHSCLRSRCRLSSTTTRQQCSRAGRSCPSPRWMDSPMCTRTQQVATRQLPHRSPSRTDRRARSRASPLASHRQLTLPRRVVEIQRCLPLTAMPPRALVRRRALLQHLPATR